MSLFRPGCEALIASPDVVKALDTLVDQGCSEEAKVFVDGALRQLCPERYAKTIVINPDSKHVMMSCEQSMFIDATVVDGHGHMVTVLYLFDADQWDVQDIVKVRNNLRMFDQRPLTKCTANVTRGSLRI